MRLTIKAEDHPGFEYVGDVFHIADTTNRIADEIVRSELIGAINGSEGTEVLVSEDTLSVFMSAVAEQVVQQG